MIRKQTHVSWVSRYQSLALSLVLLCVAKAILASPLDEKVEIFKNAPEQKEAAVVEILKIGVGEHRSAKAFASVQGWLNANPTESQELLFHAAVAAEYAGEWNIAVSFYRKFLKKKSPNAGYAAFAVPSVYRLLINHLEDSDAAYIFMREDGANLRKFGRARQFDRWFFAEAKRRKDVGAMTKWLTLILNSGDPKDNFQLHVQNLEALMRELETYNYSNEGLLKAVENLAKARNTPATAKARLNWVAAIVPVIPKMIENFEKKKPTPDSMLEKPLKAGAALVQALPFEGSILTANGWMHYGPGHSPNVTEFLKPKREAKAAPILQALSRMTTEQAQTVLKHSVAASRGRTIKDYLFSIEELRALVPKLPAVFNSLNAPDIRFFGKGLTVEAAQAMAPHFARNPHLNAAMVRAWAKPERRVSAAADQMMATELWRFAEIKPVAHSLNQSGMFERDVDYNAPIDKYAKMDARFQQLKKQVSKEANQLDRAGAFKTIMEGLLSPEPKTPGMLPLWEELFANAPDADKVLMLESLAYNQEGDRRYLFRRALDKSTFGKGKGNGRMPWRPVLTNHHFRYHHKDTAQNAGRLIKYLQTLVEAQAKTGKLDETIFGAWLHSMDKNDPATRQLMKQLSASAAYAKLPKVFHRVAADQEHFGHIARTPEQAMVSPQHLSHELLALPKEATPSQVEAAFKTVMARIANAPTPVAPLGLKRVAALEKWSDATRNLALSLFGENAPIGDYPAQQGYEPIIVRLMKEAQANKQFGALEPNSAALWKAAIYTDDHRRYYGANALATMAEKALEADSPSIAVSFSRAAAKGPIQKAVFSRNDQDIPKIAEKIRGVSGKAALAIGAVEIPVDETDPAYPIYKSNAEFVMGNLDTAWDLYEKNTDALNTEVLRKLAVEYAFWLLKRNIASEEPKRSENLIKELTIWSRQVAGSFSPEQEAKLKIAYADLAFLKGALPTSRAWYRKVADAAEYRGSEVHFLAALGSVKVDRVTKNFSAAMTELDKLVSFKNPSFRRRIHYSRAEVHMDQENYKEALDEVSSVLRQEPKHPDALILQGTIQNHMRKLVEASEIALGPSQADTVIVPGEILKVNLRDPTLSVSGIGADIEVEIWAKSGDRERVMLYQLGDSKENFRAEVATTLGPPVPNDKTLQILGEDEIRFGYSQRFRAKMKDLPPDPEIAISVASDAQLALTAGAFPPREGERLLDIEELGLSTAQAALGTRAVRPGNPVYLRVIDADASKTPAVDQLYLTLQTSSGDEIRKLPVQETAPFSGEFEVVIPTAGAQAIAFASESAPGRDPNMAVSAQDYPGWQGKVGDKDTARTFGVDLNDNVAAAKMTVQMENAQALTHFVLQTSMNGKEWTTRARYPEDTAPWDGRPVVTSFPTYRGGFPVSNPKGLELPQDWHQKMDQLSSSPSCGYMAAYVPNLTMKNEVVVNTGHPGYSGLVRFRAMFYQPNAAVRKFKVTGLPVPEGRTGAWSLFYIDGQPVDEDVENPLEIERELAPGLHTIDIWHHGSRARTTAAKLAILCDQEGSDELLPCPDEMFDPTTFPEGVQAKLPQPAKITAGEGGLLEVAFGDQTQTRLIRFVITGFKGVAPAVKKVTLADRAGKQLLPVEQDFMALRQNNQLEVLPGDTITARYEDPVSATPKRNRHEKRITVAFNTAKLTASFLNYETNPRTGERTLVLEQIRRFQYDDPVAIVIDDADMDGGPARDVVDFRVETSNGQKVVLKAVETGEHTGRFIGRVFPVEGTPSRDSEIQLPPGGTLTAFYRDAENLDPGIPTDRVVSISHAQYVEPQMGLYTVNAKAIPELEEEASGPVPAKSNKRQRTGPEVVKPRQTLIYNYMGTADQATDTPVSIQGADLRFDVVSPHLAFAGSSQVNAYVQTREGIMAYMKKNPEMSAPPFFSKEVPGTLKVTGSLSKAAPQVPDGYALGTGGKSAGNTSPLEEGRFQFTVPLVLGDLPVRSYANKSAEKLPSSAFPDGLAVKAGEEVLVGFEWETPDGETKWIKQNFKVGGHAFLDVMQNGYAKALHRVYVGEKVYIRLIARALDKGPERDMTYVELSSGSGIKTKYQVQETEGHSGIFKGVFTVGYDDRTAEETNAELPPVALNGFPVKYGDQIAVSYENQVRRVEVNNGADGGIQPFSKRYTGDEMAVRTSFTLAECFFELAKKHREMDQESLARREIGHARKLLAEALATHRDEELKAHAEYLLGNLAQEFADLAKNDVSKLPMYQDALARFSKIPTDYPESEFAAKAQYKTALVYEKMGEIDNSVEEYVKLAYKYPNHELIPMVMCRLGDYFQKKGQQFKDRAKPLREKTDEPSVAEVLRLDGLSYPEFLNAAMVFTKLLTRFPDDPLAGLAGIRAGQNFMRALQYEKSINVFQDVIENEEFEGGKIRAQAMFWGAYSRELYPTSKEDYRTRGKMIREAYQMYRRITFDFPDSIWAKRARGRLADPVFERIIEVENLARERLLEAMKYR